MAKVPPQGFQLSIFDCSSEPKSSLVQTHAEVEHHARSPLSALRLPALPGMLCHLFKERQRILNCERKDGTLTTMEEHREAIMCGELSTVDAEISIRTLRGESDDVCAGPLTLEQANAAARGLIANSNSATSGSREECDCQRAKTASIQCNTAAGSEATSSWP